MRSDDEDDESSKKKEKKGQMMVLQKVLLRVQTPDIQQFSTEEKRIVKGLFLHLNHVEFHQVLARILKMDPRERKEEEILNLKLLTQDLDFFTKINSKKFNQEAKLDEQICRRLKYERFSKGQTVIEYGANADKFFILLSGEVSIFLVKSSDSIVEEEQSLPSRQFRKLAHTGLTNLQEEIDDKEGITSEQMILLQEQGNKSPQVGSQNRTRRDSISSQLNSPMYQTGTPKYAKRFSMMVLSPQAKYFGSEDKQLSLNVSSNQNKEDHPLDKFCRKPYDQVKKQEEILQQQEQHQQLNQPNQSSSFGESSPQIRRTSGQPRLSIFNQKYESEFSGFSTPNSSQSNQNGFLRPQNNSRSRLVTQMSVQYDERSPNEIISNKQPFHQLHRLSFQQSTVSKDDNQHPSQNDALTALKQFQRNIQENQLSNSHRLFQPKSESTFDEQIQNPKNYRNFGKSIQQLTQELQQLDPINENPEQFLNQPLPSLQQKTSGDSSNSNSNNIMQNSKSQKLLDSYKTIQAFGDLHLSEIDNFERFFTETGVFKFQYKGKLTEGSTFGELGILEGKPRSALIVCSADSEFAIMEKDDYQELLAERDRKHLRQKFEFLKNHIFPDLTNDAIKKIFYTFQKKKYKMHDVVFAQGEPPNGVFIIIKGEMSLSQKLNKNDILDEEMRNKTDRDKQQDIKDIDIEDDGENDGSYSDFSRTTQVFRKLRVQQQKRFSRTFAVIGMGEYFGEEDLLLKDNFEAQKRHYTAKCHSIKASVYFIEAGFFMRFLKSKPNSQLIIEQRLAKKTQWRQHYKDRVNENIKLHGLLLSKQQQQALQTSTISPQKSIETSSSQLFTCVPLSARTLKRLSQGSKSQQAFLQHSNNALDSQSSKSIQLSTPPPSLSYLLRELKPLGPIPKAALALSTNQSQKPFLSPINCLTESSQLQNYPKDILCQNDSQNDQKINNGSSILNFTGKQTAFQSTQSAQSRLPSEPSAGSPIIFQKLPKLPSSNKPQFLNTDRPSYFFGTTDLQSSENALINDPSSLTSRQEISQQEIISAGILKNETKNIGSPKILNQNTPRHVFLTKHGLQDTNTNKDIQSSRSPKNSLMNFCLKKIKLKTDSIDSILRYDELKNSPSRQTFAGFFDKPNNSSNQMIDQQQHQSHQENSNIAKTMQTSFRHQIFQTFNQLSPADQDNTKITKMQNNLSDNNQGQSSSFSSSKERITTSTTRQKLFSSSKQDNPVRTNGSFDSKVDQMKLKKQIQEVIFKPNSSSSMNKLHLLQLKQSTINTINTPKSTNNFNVIQVHSARQQL